MDLRVLAQHIERLRREAVGAPKLVMHGSLRAYQYEEQSAKVVAMLKLVRAAHGVSAMNMLAGEGLMIDFGALARGVYDAIYETYFLLEEYPKISSNVDQFVRGFFETTISGFREARVPQVPTKKIRAAVTRAVMGTQDEAYRTRLDRIFHAFSGYVHANYAHITEVYFEPDDSFNLLGLPDIDQRLSKAELVERAGIDVLLAASFAASRLGLSKRRDEIFAFAESEHTRLEGA